MCHDVSSTLVKRLMCGLFEQALILFERDYFLAIKKFPSMGHIAFNLTHG